MSMTWHAGRQLSEITKNDTAISYKYNDSGIRTEKLANGVKTEYYIIGDTIAAEKRSDGIKIIYLTDESGVKIVFTISGSSADGFCCCTIPFFFRNTNIYLTHLYQYL